MSLLESALNSSGARQAALAAIEKLKALEVENRKSAAAAVIREMCYREAWQEIEYQLDKHKKESDETSQT